jgi:hypothetical protein
LGGLHRFEVDVCGGLDELLFVAAAGPLAREADEMVGLLGRHGDRLHGCDVRDQGGGEPEANVWLVRDEVLNGEHGLVGLVGLVGLFGLGAGVLGRGVGDVARGNAVGLGGFGQRGADRELIHGQGDKAVEAGGSDDALLVVGGDVRAEAEARVVQDQRVEAVVA